MYKKAISIMSVMLIVFLCFQFPVFADGTAPGKTITTSTVSYNNGDVTLFARVNGRYSGDDGYPSSSGTQHANYQHTFEFVLANNTNDFQVADTNMFSIMLFSGSSTVFASSGNSSNYNAGWGASVDDYSSNMSAPEITFYKTGDYAGNVYIRFYDNDLLVLNPNETRIYSFTITFTQDLSTNYAYLNGNSMYSYFTYSGSVSFYSRPTNFTANTINDFINNDSLPNSAIAYYQYLIDQGIENNELLADILTVLNTAYSNNTYNLGSQDYIFSQGTWGSSSDGSVSGKYYINCRGALPVDYDYVSSVINTSNYSYDAIYDIPVYLSINLANYSQSDVYRLSAATTINFDLNPSITNNGATQLGTSVDVVLSDGLFISRLQYDSLICGFNQFDNGIGMIPGSSFYNLILCKHYYYGVVGTNESTQKPKVNSISVTAPSLSFVKGSYSGSNTTWSLFDIRSKIQEILNGYNTNQPNASAVDQGSNDIQDESDDNHQTELSYFEQTNQALSTTGIENYQFNNEQIGGIGGVSNDFTLVYNSLGSWTSVYIFSLTLSLGLAIIRHVRPIHRSKEE